MMHTARFSSVERYGEAVEVKRNSLKVRQDVLSLIVSRAVASSCVRKQIMRASVHPL